LASGIACCQSVRSPGQPFQVIAAQFGGRTAINPTGSELECLCVFDDGSKDSGNLTQALYPILIAGLLLRLWCAQQQFVQAVRVFFRDEGLLFAVGFQMVHQIGKINRRTHRAS
jgi:hypothetical protein